jgi:hypothetical protein
MEFHSPQPSQRPDHLVKELPQALQLKVLFCLAMAP